VSGGDALPLECSRIVRYLAGVEPKPELVDRYRRAHEHLLRDPPSREDQLLLDAVRRQAWTLPLLDAATGLVAPHSRLRSKVLLVVALLETDPAFAARFEEESLSLPVLVVRLAWAAVAAVAKAAAGLIVYAVLVKRGRAARSETPGAAVGT
jgi:hypothetical protein